MSYCAFMDIRCYRIPNRALAAAAAVGLAVTVGAWAAGYWFLGGRGCGRCCIYHAAGVGGRSRFPIFPAADGGGRGY